MPRFCQSLDHKVNGCSLDCKLKLRISPGIRREPAKPDKDKELARSLVAAAPAGHSSISSSRPAAFSASALGVEVITLI